MPRAAYLARLYPHARTPTLATATRRRGCASTPASCALCEDNDVPIIDARSWASEEDFIEGIHLTQSGGASFTKRLESEVLQPYLVGARSARRMPRDGPVTPPWCSAARGLASSIAPTASSGSRCGAQGELILLNPADQPRRVVLRFRAFTRAPGAANLALDGPLPSERLAINENGVSVERVVELAPGRHGLRLSCDGPPVMEQAGSLAFGLSDLTLSVAEPIRAAAAQAGAVAP